jgi:sulfur-oxidizing protein SoxX
MPLGDPAGAAAAEAPPGAGSCSGCHPTSAAVQTPVKRLVGRPAAETVAALQAFRAGQRPATVMDRIVGNRQQGLCLLCHSGPFPEDRLQGTLAPGLAGVASRLSIGQLRLRIVDASRVNPNTIMPPYYRTQDLTRVAPSYAGKPILSAGQVEDVVAFLATLTE